MLKVRCNLETGLLSGWFYDSEPGYLLLLPRENEAVIELNITKPEPSSDYEYWEYDGVDLVRSDKLELSLEPIPSFTPLNPVEGVEHRLNHVEEFLQERFP